MLFTKIKMNEIYNIFSFNVIYLLSFCVIEKNVIEKMKELENKFKIKNQNGNNS
jgi:hypothetical protein